MSLSEVAVDVDVVFTAMLFDSHVANNLNNITFKDRYDADLHYWEVRILRCKPLNEQLTDEQTFQAQK